MALNTDLNPVHALSAVPAPKTAGQRKLWKACQGFESVMLGMVFKELNKGVGKDDPLNQGQASSIYHDMLNDEMSKSVVKSGGIGLADDIYRQLYTAVK